MKLFKNLFGSKETTVETTKEVVVKKEKKRTMPEVNQKELYRIEKQKRREAAAKERKIKEQEELQARKDRLAEIKLREEQAKKEQEAKREELARKNAEVKEKANETKKTKAVKEEKVELFGYEFDLLSKGQTIEVELMDEDNSNYYVRSLTNFQDAILPKVELDSEVNIGDKINVLVFKFYAEEFYVSERRLNNKERSAKLDGTYNQGDIVEATVKSYEDPFFTVELSDGMTAKVYQANIDTKFVNGENAEEFIGKSYKFVIKRKMRKSHTVELELERKTLIENELNEKFNEIQIGDRLVVESFTANKGGLEFDYNGFRGFIPLSEISYFFYKNSTEALADIDAAKEVEVIELKAKRNQTVICSIRACEKSPWEIIRDEYQTGDTITRDVKDKKDFGLIFEIEKNVHGLLHTSEMSNELASEMKNVSIGDTVTFMIKDIDTINQRIALTNIKE